MIPNNKRLDNRQFGHWPIKNYNLLCLSSIRFCFGLLNHWIMIQMDYCRIWVKKGNWKEEEEKKKKREQESAFNLNVCIKKINL